MARRRLPSRRSGTSRHSRAHDRLPAVDFCPIQIVLSVEILHDCFDQLVEIQLSWFRVSFNHQFRRCRASRIEKMVEFLATPAGQFVRRRRTRQSDAAGRLQLLRNNGVRPSAAGLPRAAFGDRGRRCARTLGFGRRWIGDFGCGSSFGFSGRLRGRFCAGGNDPPLAAFGGSARLANCPQPGRAHPPGGRAIPRGFLRYAGPAMANSLVAG